MRLSASTFVLFRSLVLGASISKNFEGLPDLGDKPGSSDQSRDPFNLLARGQSPTPYVQNAAFSTVDNGYGILQ